MGCDSCGSCLARSQLGGRTTSRALDRVAQDLLRIGQRVDHLDDAPRVGFVVGLEFATGVRAHILGKPSPEVFRQAVAGLRADLGERLPRSAFAMVGDDLHADVAAAQRVGMKGILVLSGKTGAAEAERAGLAARGPDGIGATLADVVAALD